MAGEVGDSPSEIQPLALRMLNQARALADPRVPPGNRLEAMCTLVLLRRPDAAWPLVLAANRDELASRPARPPGRHWPDRPEVVAGLDAQAGGSWLGINDHGVLAGVLNRVGTLGPATGKRSRGELVLEALDHADAASAVAALADLDPDAYRPFNLVPDEEELMRIRSHDFH